MNEKHQAPNDPRGKYVAAMALVLVLSACFLIGFLSPAKETLMHWSLWTVPPWTALGNVWSAVIDVWRLGNQYYEDVLSALAGVVFYSLLVLFVYSLPLVWWFLSRMGAGKRRLEG